METYLMILVYINTYVHTYVSTRWDTRGVMVIVVENGLVDRSSNPGLCRLDFT